jgi:hypothetical protein
MPRRCISLCVIIGVFASQLAMVPHAHAGMSPVERQQHGGTPHFHGGWQGHGHHVHGHSHNGRSHHHDCPTESESAPAPDIRTSLGHDATAVFFPANVTLASAGPGQSAQLELATGPGELAVCQPIVELERTGGGFERGRPPDRVLDDSGRYLVLRNLRI